MGLRPGSASCSHHAKKKVSEFLSAGFVQLGMMRASSCCGKWCCVSLSLKSAASSSQTRTNVTEDPDRTETRTNVTKDPDRTETRTSVTEDPDGTETRTNVTEDPDGVCDANVKPFLGGTSAPWETDTSSPAASHASILGSNILWCKTHRRYQTRGRKRR